MKKSIASLVFILTMFGSPLFALGLGTPPSSESKPIDTQLVSKWSAFDGKVIKRINFVGLKRTKEQALRWIMKTSEGQAFSSEQLAKDVQTIYNTGNLYDVSALIQASSDSTETIDIIVSLADKWTLLPVAGAQGGGGALTYGGGIYDTNLFGYFIHTLFFAYNYNGVFSYNLNLSEEYLAGTQLMTSVDWSYNVNPTRIYNLDRSSAGDFSWARQQEEVMIGTHMDGPTRLLFFGDYFYDAMLSDVGVNAYVYSGVQYKLRPQLIYGRVNITDFLEQGYELNIQTSFANFLSPTNQYQGVTASLRQVFILPDQINIAYNLYTSTMSTAPPPYEYQVGGYTNLRGYADNRQIGPYQVGGNLEYRPLLFTHRYSFLDLDLVAVQGCLFTDFGSAWGDSTLTRDKGAEQLNMLWSAGAGVRFNFVHFAGAIMRLDVARTIRPDEGFGVSFGVGQFF